MPVIGALLLGYLLGSIPFGLVLTRLAGLGDIRRIGSGNIGATNVLRTGNKALAAATLLLDGLKGAVAVLVAARFGGGDPVLAAGTGAVWLIVACLSRISSLAALLSFALAPVVAALVADTTIVKLTLVIAVVVFGRHHTNIRRLIAGTEPRIGQKT